MGITEEIADQGIEKQTKKEKEGNNQLKRRQGWKSPWGGFLPCESFPLKRLLTESSN